MPRFVPSINETVEQVLSEVSGGLQIKTAARRPTAPAVNLPPLKKIAEALRQDKDPGADLRRSSRREIGHDGRRRRPASCP
jgi:hypothetical protein